MAYDPIQLNTGNETLNRVLRWFQQHPDPFGGFSPAPIGGMGVGILRGPAAKTISDASPGLAKALMRVKPDIVATAADLNPSLAQSILEGGKTAGVTKYLERGSEISPIAEQLEKYAIPSSKTNLPTRMSIQLDKNLGLTGTTPVHEALHAAYASKYGFGYPPPQRINEMAKYWREKGVPGPRMRQPSTAENVIEKLAENVMNAAKKRGGMNVAPPRAQQLPLPGFNGPGQ